MRIRGQIKNRHLVCAHATADIWIAESAGDVWIHAVARDVLANLIDDEQIDILDLAARKQGLGFEQKRRLSV